MSQQKFDLRRSFKLLLRHMISRDGTSYKKGTDLDIGQALTVNRSNGGAQHLRSEIDGMACISGGANLIKCNTRYHNASISSRSLFVVHIGMCLHLLDAL